MKNISFLLLIIALVLCSCEKNVIEYPMQEVNTAVQTQLRVLNVLPYSGNTDTLLLNNTKVSSVSTSNGNLYPTSATPRYFVLPIGVATISLNFLSKSTTPALAAFKYTGSATLSTGKWSAYIYDKTKDPVLLEDDNDIPSTDAWNDTVCFVKFANFFFQKDGVTPYGKMTLKAKKNFTGATWETIASDVDFKTQSSYYKYKLKNTKSLSIWSGTEENITFALFDSQGVMFKSFSSTSSSTKADYSSPLWSLIKGRGYVIYLCGKEGTSNSTDQILNLKSFNTK